MKRCSHSLVSITDKKTLVTAYLLLVANLHNNVYCAVWMDCCIDFSNTSKGHFPHLNSSYSLELGLNDELMLVTQQSAEVLSALYVTGPAKINHVSANYTELYFC